MVLAIKRVHNKVTSRTLVMFRHYLTLHKKTEKLCCLPLNSVSDSEKNRFWWVWSGSEKSRLCG